VGGSKAPKNFVSTSDILLGNLAPGEGEHSSFPLIGIIVGAVAAVAMCLAIVLVLFLRRRKSRTAMVRVFLLYLFWSYVCEDAGKYFE